VVRLDRMQGYQQQEAPGVSPRGRAALHGGVVQFMNGVYLWMMIGVGVTAAVAWGISQSNAALSLFYTPTGMSALGWIALFSPLVMLFIARGRLQNWSPAGATAFFLVFAATFGIMFSTIPIVFGMASIAKALIATIGMFAGMAAFGFLTKKDLSGIGQFLLMALFGIIIASLVNVFFVQSAQMHMAIDIVCVLVFAGLTAYDTQQIKQFYLVHGNRGNVAVLGALNLYLDFINIFIHLLHLFGNRD
jgi:FtsH-binding integral membrane protein